MINRAKGFTKTQKLWKKDIKEFEIRVCMMGNCWGLYRNVSTQAHKRNSYCKHFKTLLNSTAISMSQAKNI